MKECQWPKCICSSRTRCQRKGLQSECAVIARDKCMEQIEAESGHTLQKTHTLFFEANIIAETEKALRIKVINRKGAQTTVWVPKSRCSFEICKRRAQAPPHDFIDLKKYYAPNFFIK